jgi:hypothetical protein
MYEPFYPLRVQLPVDFVRRIDRLIKERLIPFDSRDAFIADAVGQLLTEVESLTDVAAVPRLPPEVVPGPVHIVPGPRPAADAPWWEHRLAEFGISPFQDPELTALQPPADGPTYPPDESLIVDELLFGLHNRDYPSFWALDQLCDATQSGPISIADFRGRLADRAVQFAMMLGRLDEDRPKRHPRVSGLFPLVDPHDWRAVSRAISRFMQVAVGSIHRERATGRPRLHGPLFTWRLAAVDRPDPKAANIAPTPLAYTLFRELRGLQVDIPHESFHAGAFFQFLREHVPGDRAGFEELLAGVMRGESRDQLVDGFRNRFELAGSVPETNVQGYVSRAREWGLLSPGRGQYELTEVGSDVARMLGV